MFGKLTLGRYPQGWGALSSEPRTVIRDSVWGDIALYDRELKLIDTPPFQRLRRVQQLGFLSLTFPGAHHTRFEHSLGVLHLARVVLLRLLHLPSCPKLNEEDVSTALAAALLHDIGHYPYSHAVEELELRMIRRHEDIGKEIITCDPVASILVEHWKVDPRRVASLLDKKARAQGPDGLFQDLLSGALDADKLDYLPRDAHYCNVPYGVVDTQRLVLSLRVWHEPEEERLRLVIDEKGIGALQSLVFAKYLMFYNVYWHKTSRLATVMFLRAVQDALEAQAITPAELERCDDWSIVDTMRRRTESIISSQELLRRLEARQLYKLAVEVSDHDSSFGPLAALKSDPTRRREVEIAWAGELSWLCGRTVSPHHVLLDIPEPKSFSVDMQVLERANEGHASLLTPWAKRSGLGDDDMARFHRHIRRLRVAATDRQLAAEVARYWPALQNLARAVLGS